MVVVLPLEKIGAAIFKFKLLPRRGRFAVGRGGLTGEETGELGTFDLLLPRWRLAGLGREGCGSSGKGGPNNNNGGIGGISGASMA